MSTKTKKEALTVSRIINEVLVSQLGIPFRNIVNDCTFTKYTGSKRPDLLISNIEYDDVLKNDSAYIDNLVCYVEAKDSSCIVDDKDWKDALSQGKVKAPKLKIPFFGITNCHSTFFYNAATGKRLSLNGNYISEFQTLDVLRIIKQRLTTEPMINDIKIGVDSLSSVSEAIFNKKLWELREIYRGIDFANGTQKIDFTIGMIALEYYEEKAEIDGKKDTSEKYWSDGKKYSTEEKDAEELRTLICTYIDRLNEPESDFKEFSSLLQGVRNLIFGTKKIISPVQLQSIYLIIDSMKPMHGTGFDLFGAVYESFANSKEKKDFGEYFTRRHYAHVLAELLLKDEEVFSKIKIIDPGCGTGGMLTESFKVLRANYQKSGTLDEEAVSYLSQSCFYGVDIRRENITRTRLNMFLVGDGHTNMTPDNSLKPSTKDGKVFLADGQYDYVITNPPYGAGTIKARTDRVGSSRMEIAFLCKIIDLLKINGKACIITPDGILENPSLKSLREEILSVCKIEAIVSLPKFAFAPYTKEKTFAIFLKKIHNRNYNVSRSSKKSKNLATGKFQKDPIWMYIIDNDGFANSDKRFPTRLRDIEQCWLHDEVSGYSDNEGVEKDSLLSQRWKVFDDKATSGTEWINEKGETVKYRKGGWVKIEEVIASGALSLLPEQYFRPFSPHYITMSDFINELTGIES